MIKVLCSLLFPAALSILLVLDSNLLTNDYDDSFHKSYEAFTGVVEFVTKHVWKIGILQMHKVTEHNDLNPDGITGLGPFSTCKEVPNSPEVSSLQKC